VVQENRRLSLGVQATHQTAAGSPPSSREWVFGRQRRRSSLLWMPLAGGKSGDRTLGGIIRTNPISYQSEGKQVMAIAAGNGMFTFELGEPAHY